MIKTPCFKCKDRVAGCHAECERYKEYRTQMDELNRQKEAQKATYSYKRMRFDKFNNSKPNTFWKCKK